MPPKAKPQEAPPPAANLPSVDVTLKFNGVLDSIPYTSIHVRVVCSWFDCFRTEAIGAGGASWVDIAASEDAPTGDEVFQSPRLLPTVCESIKTIPVHPMGSDPSKAVPVVHVIILGCEGMDRIVPLEFLLLDCSKMVLEPATIRAGLVSSFGFSLDCTIKSSAPLFQKPEDLRALVVNVSSLEEYPCNANETTEQSLQHAFVYGDMKFGPLRKTVYSRAILPDSSSTAAPSMGCEVCVLIPEKDFEVFKDSLTSTTFVLEAHDEDISRRAFNRRNVDKYTELFKEEEGDDAPVPSPRGAVGGKSMSKQGSKAPAAEPDDPVAPKRTIAATSGSVTGKDEFLVQCVQGALESASQLRAHGTVRFRLEKLLETSPDILKRFEEKRGVRAKPIAPESPRDANGGDAVVKGALSDPSLIYVEDELTLEVREAKARKPERWQIPTDLSLKTYLGKQKTPAVDMGNTIKSMTLGSTMGSAVTTGTISALKKERPKYERFDSSQTRLQVKVRLYRPKLDMQKILETETLHHTTLFKDPTLPPPAPLMHPIERKEAEQLRQKNAAIEASHKAKAEKLAQKPPSQEKKVEIAEPSTAVEESPRDFDAALVSEKSPREPEKKGKKSPRSGKSSPRPKSALKEPTPEQPVEVVPKAAATPDINPYDRESTLKRMLNMTPYTRMVFIFKYDNDNMLEALNHALNDVNMRALPNIQGTVRSYSLSEEEVEAANNGELDLVCGFSIIDDDTRMVVLEGLAGYDKGMESIFIDMPRFNVNTKDVKILSNPEVLFPSRIYTEYGPDVKRIRPRDKLKKLVQKPELYDRKQVDAVCFEALEKIMELKGADFLQQTKDLAMYPSAESLNKMELLYGEAISKADIEGCRAMRAKKAAKIKQAGGIDNSTITASYGSDDASNKNLIGEQVGGSSSHAGEVSAYGVNSVDFKKTRTSRLAETDCWNDFFVERLAQRDFAHPKHNYVMEQRELRKKAWRRGLDRRAQRDVEDQETLERLKAKNPQLKSGLMHGYASQSVNIKDMLLSDTRDRLKDDKNATYTYSSDFQSQTLVLVDEYADRLKIQAANKAKNFSKKGFVYPAPKTREEMITHPKKPSAVRIEELRIPFRGEETEFVDNTGHTMLPEIREKNMKLHELERGFDNKLTGNRLFGMQQPPKFERDFELSAIGDRTKLPRGLLVEGTEQNPEFWRSVHASGDEGIKLQERIQQEEKELWKSKVVVDTLDFKVGNFKVKDKAAQWQRYEDMLKDDPKTKAFKHLRTEKKYETLPIAVMTQGEYVQNAAAKALLRAEDKEKFITSAEIEPGTNGVPKDFTRYINRHTDKPKIQTKVHKLKHPPINYGSMDTTGPKWGDHVRPDQKSTS